MTPSSPPPPIAPPLAPPPPPPPPPPSLNERLSRDVRQALSGRRGFILRSRLGASALSWTITLTISLLGLITGVVSMERFVATEVDRELDLARSQGLASAARRLERLAGEDAALSRLSWALAEELKLTPGLTELALYSAGGEPLTDARAHPTAAPLSLTALRAASEDPAQLSRKLSAHAGRLYELVWGPEWVTHELATPLRLSGAEALLLARFDLHPLRARSEARVLLLWGVLGLVTLVFSLLSLILLRYHIARPLQSLLEFVRAQRRLNAPPPPALEEAPRELISLYGAFVETLEQLKDEGKALARVHLTLQHREGLATAGLVSASVMHEIGNPLTSVIGLLDLLLRGGQLDERQRELVTRALKELRRIEATKRQLLTLTRPPRRQLEVASLHDVVSWARQMLSYQPAHRDAWVEVHVDPSIKIFTDVGALRHATLNLLMNAAHAQGGAGHTRVSVELNAPPPAPELTQHQSLSGVSARPEAPQGGLRLHISDAGAGLSPEQAARLFEPFRSSKGEGGSGLGLAIAAALAQEGGGLLWLNPSPPAGSSLGGACFTLWLPTAPPNASVSSQPTPLDLMAVGGDEPAAPAAPAAPPPFSAS